MGTKGFITLATGNDKYYKAAANLLKSYQIFHSEKSKYNISNSPKLPFAILADQENEYTKLFDKVIILKNPTKSYFDKILLLNNIPYDESIFIEADCLAYDDLNKYFEIFKSADDFSALGYITPNDSKDNWLFIFARKYLPKYADNISFIPHFHSAVIFMRKNSQKCAKMFNYCIEANNNITNKLDAIDDYLFILSSAIVGCKTTDYIHEHYSVYPIALVENLKPKVRIDIKENSFQIKGQKKRIKRAMICHFGNFLTTKYLYKREVRSINSILNGKSPKFYLYITAICYPIYKVHEYFSFFIKPKMIDTLSKSSFLKKIWHFIK